MRNIHQTINQTIKYNVKQIQQRTNITRIPLYECRHSSFLSSHSISQSQHARHLLPLSFRLVQQHRWNTTETNSSQSINQSVNQAQTPSIIDASNQTNNQSNNQNNQSDYQSKQQSNDQSNNQSNNQQKEERPRSKFFLFRILQGIWRWYSGALNKRPYLVQSLTSGFLFAIGDITAQHYEAHLDEQKALAATSSKQTAAHGRDLIHHHELHVMEPHSSGFSWHRLFACTMFGLAIMGPGGQFWYTKLDIVVGRWYKPLTIKNTLTKVALDTIIFNPIFLVVFFSSVSLMEGASWADIRHKLYRDFVPSYAVDCSIWPLVQCFNFRFTPVNFQLLVVNLFCYFDDVFLSYVQHNGMPSIFVGIETWWLNYIGEKPKHQPVEAPTTPQIEDVAVTPATPRIEDVVVTTSQ